MKLHPSIADIFLTYACDQYLSHYSNDSFIGFAKDLMASKLSINWRGEGTYGSCFSDELTEVDAEEEPYFIAFNNLLENYILDDALHSELYDIIETDTQYDNDYYGGQTTTHYKYIYILDIFETIQKHYETSDNDVYLDEILNKYGPFVEKGTDYTQIKEIVDMNDKLSDNLIEKTKPKSRKI